MRASIVGFFGYSYPEAIMKERVDSAVNALKSKGADINFCGYVTDHDEGSQIAAKEKLDKSAFDSDCLIVLISLGWNQRR